MLFNNEAEGSVAERLTMASAPFGERIDSLGRYKLPLLPGESGTKSGGDWVPFGVQSATNLAGSIVESRQLGIWERRKTQIGLALRPDLAEQQAILINKALLNGFNFAESRLQGEGSTPEGNAIAVELDRIHAEAKQAAGGNLAAQRGTNRHDVWEARAQTGQLLGTPAVNEQIERLEQLLEEKHLRRVPAFRSAWCATSRSVPRASSTTSCRRRRTSTSPTRKGDRYIPCDASSPRARCSWPT
jgi:hypothetical protein